jgi:protein-disulfide isomerase
VRERAGQVLAVPRPRVRQPAKARAADLKQLAAELGLDTSRFNACVDSHKYADDVEADINAGNEAGVNGTPAFFINGRMLSGAQPFEEFKKIIDDELAAKKK